MSNYVIWALVQTNAFGSALAASTQALMAASSLATDWNEPHQRECRARDDRQRKCRVHAASDTFSRERPAFNQCDETVSLTVDAMRINSFAKFAGEPRRPCQRLIICNEGLPLTHRNGRVQEKILSKAWPYALRSERVGKAKLNEKRRPERDRSSPLF